MARTRASTDADDELLTRAREVTGARSDSGIDPVPPACAVNLDSVESVSLGVLVDRVGRLSDERMRAICDALSVAVDCH